MHSQRQKFFQCIFYYKLTENCTAFDESRSLNIFFGVNHLSEKTKDDWFQDFCNCLFSNPYFESKKFCFKLVVCRKLKYKFHIIWWRSQTSLQELRVWKIYQKKDLWFMNFLLLPFSNPLFSAMESRLDAHFVTSNMKFCISYVKSQNVPS